MVHEQLLRALQSPEKKNDLHTILASVRLECKQTDGVDIVQKFLERVFHQDLLGRYYARGCQVYA